MSRLAVPKKTLIKQFLMIFLPIISIVILLSWLIYYFHFIKTQEEVLKAKEINSLAMQKEFIQQTIKSIISDINVIAANRTLKDSLSKKLKDTTSHVTADFLILSKYKGIYDQIRILDKTGMEVIRVDLRNNKPTLIPADQLQFKGKRYYFQDTYRLGKGEIFMSPFDLNIEKGEIELPFKPMIRFGISIFDNNDEKQGVLILNYLGQKLIDDLSRLSAESPGHLMIVNSEGYWLKGMAPEDEWGFMFEEGPQKTIQKRYPKIWQEIKKSKSGQFFVKDGLITFVKIFPFKEGIKSSSGSGKPFEESEKLLSSDQFFWVVMSHVLEDELHERNNNFILSLFFADLLLMILLGGLSWLLVVSNTKRRLAEKALIKLNLELEEKIKQRTQALFDTNVALEKEVAEHLLVIKEKQKIESQLRQAQKMEAIGTLAGGIAHDFNNILTPIMGYAEMALLQLEQDNPLLDDINRILSASHRAKDLVQQILTFSRQTEYELRPIRIQLVIQEVIKLLNSTIPPTIEIVQDIKPDCNPVLADQTQIHQVIMNLCTNAYHAMHDKGGILGITLLQVEIGPEDYQNKFQLAPGTYVKLEVSDTGHGMTGEVREKIFEPYYTTKKEGDGTGLGLSVVHGIIKSLNGHILTYSEPEKGTTFNIYLPSEEGETEHYKPVLKINLPQGTENILVIDDEEPIMALKKQILESLGYRVTGLTSSIRALDLLEKDPDAFDLVITDMTMPKMNGIELIKKIAGIKPGISTILCTGFSYVITAETAKDKAVTGFLTKPVSLKELAETVRRVLDTNNPPIVSPD